jgi:LysM repeat protein
MTRKNSPTTRILAAAALLAAVAILFVVVAGNTGSDDKSGKSNQAKTAKNKKKDGKKSKSKAQTYEVKSGDTLTGIAADTGVPVDELQVLNPDLDPQALIAGQKLKLR